MNFAEARKKLKTLAGGRSYSVTYEVMEYAHSGKSKQECHLWINDIGIFSGATWTEAFNNLPRNIEPIKEAS